MKVYLGAESIISPSGNAEQCFEKIEEGIAGVKNYSDRGFNKESFYLSAFEHHSFSFDQLLKDAILQSLKSFDEKLVTSDKTLLIISSTKGDLSKGYAQALTAPASAIQKDFRLKHFPLIISNACASGVMAINTAAHLLQIKKFEHIIVAGIDLISDFILYGFQSLYALSNEASKPFDKERKGINLGEGSAAVVVSTQPSAFKSECYRWLGGCTAGDANHISGPSRTGEGLYRSVLATLKDSGVTTGDIDFISAHGTATLFNDEMEAIAMNRLNMQHIPLNSFKGFFGHTLGAAGIIETAMCIQSMRKNVLLKSVGYDESGTSVPLHIIEESKSCNINTVLKTASGFGGCNASLIIQKNS